MQFDYVHPADQLLLIMERIYKHGMTTTSGGNLSIKDDNGDIWITPAGVDKGSLSRRDMVCVKADGRVQGIHKPSSEFPFHRLIYCTRPDLNAIVHAHPPALVSFSIVRRIPDTRLLPNERKICGRVGMAPYALPGSEQLGENIAAVFAEGINTVMLENHGVVVGGKDLFEAFRIFETLDFCARLEIEARRIGKPVLLTDEDYDTVRNKGMVALDSYTPISCPVAEREARQEMCGFIRRAYLQGLFTSTQGTFSQRLDQDNFLITPYGKDRNYLTPEDLVRIEGGRSEAGKTPSKSVLLHQAIYKQQPHVESIIIAHPPNIMAFAVTDMDFDSRTIPESYILLRGTPKLRFDAVYNEPEETAAVFVKTTPIAIVKNNCVMVTGQGLLNTFDRLEVAEYSAKSILASRALGDIVHIDDGRIRDLEVAFKLE
ncbi:class II aldolase/adducin family protein [Cohnella silvisoli]|uniref:Class II aldolase/adducin family protein n=1 Tax=Cohnella silvisoli TaxID=2873699 RepID=A0ABV1KS71_9BACL|nr:class II aldolase/adducin family protein [Cohnella silvisoli]MCD9022647.1 class II aldolase/adducin family protein [Cohnella silvisoli]